MRVRVRRNSLDGFFLFFGYVNRSDQARQDRVRLHVFIHSDAKALLQNNKLITVHIIMVSCCVFMGFMHQNKYLYIPFYNTFINMYACHALDLLIDTLPIRHLSEYFIVLSLWLKCAL